MPEWRPDIIETVNIVIDVVSNKSTVKALLDLPREDAYPVIDLLYGVCLLCSPLCMCHINPIFKVADNEPRLAIAPRLANRVSDTLRRMCAKYQWLPGACIVPAGRLTLLGDTAIDCGGYADVWRATYHDEARSVVVALKVFRVYAKDKLRRVRKVRILLRDHIPLMRSASAEVLRGSYTVAQAPPQEYRPLAGCGHDAVPGLSGQCVDEVRQHFWIPPQVPRGGSAKTRAHTVFPPPSFLKGTLCSSLTSRKGSRICMPKAWYTVI